MSDVVDDALDLRARAERIAFESLERELAAADHSEGER